MLVLRLNLSWTTSRQPCRIHPPGWQLQELLIHDSHLKLSFLITQMTIADNYRWCIISACQINVILAHKVDLIHVNVTSHCKHSQMPKSVLSSQTARMAHKNPGECIHPVGASHCLLNNFTTYLSKTCKKNSTIKIPPHVIDTKKHQTTHQNHSCRHR